MTQGWESLHIDLPSWCGELASPDTCYPTEHQRMQLAVDLARENVLRGTGGPFGAAVFEQASGRLVGLGVNSVERLHNSALHAEVLALMLAEARRSNYSLNAPELPAHALYSSCEPCAMCLGALLWSGVKRLVFAAGRDDACRIGFEEGPVFPESYAFLRRRGLVIERGPLADEARAVLDLYASRGRLIYNG